MSNEQNTKWYENKKEFLVHELFSLIKKTREQEGLTIEEISNVIKSAMGEDTQFLIKELQKREMESHPLFKCQFDCGKELTEEEFAEHMGICNECRDKYIEDKINTDFIEGVKPDNETDL